MPNPLQAHTDRLALLCESWISIEIEVETSLDNSRGGTANEPTSLKTREHYIECVDGRRFLERVLQTGPEPHPRTVLAADGERCYEVLFRNGSNPAATDFVRISRAFGTEARTGCHECPVPLFYFFRGTGTLADALEQAVYLGPARLSGSNCDRYLLPSEGGVITEYWLDASSSVPRRVLSFLNEADRLSNRPNTDWTAKEIETTQGIAFPIVSELAHFQAGEKQPFAIKKMVVTKIKFNEQYPISRFRPEVPPAALVYDGFKMAVTQAPPPVGIASLPSATTTPLDASQPLGQGRWIGPAALSLGAILLLAALVLALKRRA